MSFSHTIGNTYHSLSPLTRTILIAGISSAATICIMAGPGTVAASVISYAASHVTTGIYIAGGAVAIVLAGVIFSGTPEKAYKNGVQDASDNAYRQLRAIGLQMYQAGRYSVQHAPDSVVEGAVEAIVEGIESAVTEE